MMYTMRARQAAASDAIWWLCAFSSSTASSSKLGVVRNIWVRRRNAIKAVSKGRARLERASSISYVPRQLHTVGRSHEKPDAERLTPWINMSQQDVRSLRPKWFGQGSADKTLFSHNNGQVCTKMKSTAYVLYVQNTGNNSTNLCTIHLIAT